MRALGGFPRLRNVYTASLCVCAWDCDCVCVCVGIDQSADSHVEHGTDPTLSLIHMRRCLRGVEGRYRGSSRVFTIEWVYI